MGFDIDQLRGTLTPTLSQRERELTARGFKLNANQSPLPLGEGGFGYWIL